MQYFIKLCKRLKLLFCRDLMNLAVRKIGMYIFYVSSWFSMARHDKGFVLIRQKRSKSNLS